MRRIFFIAIITIAFLSQNGFSQTKLKFVNNTSQLISAAYVKYTGTTDGWVSKGWYNVNPGKSVEINLGTYNYTTVYVHGFYKTTQWGSGQYQFCVEPKKAFSITNADKDCNLTKKTFSEFKIETGKVNTWSFNPSNNNVPNNNVSTTNLSQQKIDEFVVRHNYWRNEVNSPNMVWSETLAQYAYQWAKHLADNGLFEHRNPNKYGENIFMCSSCTINTYSPSTVVDDWASEKALYNGEKISNTNFSAFGHYTQIIWCQTTQVGCAMVESSDGNVLVVCNYAPAGNMIGSYPTCK